MKIARPAALSAAVVGGVLGRALRRRHRRVAEAIDPALRSPVLYLPLDVRDERTLRVGRALVPLASPRATVPVRDERARGAAGHDVRVLVFEPDGRRAPSGALLWVHGGGLVLGAPEADNRFLSGVASALGIVVVGVDYRLAPEHPFPAALDDCAAALAWLHDNAAALGVDPQRIAIGGGSAGGGLAASLAQRTLDEGGPPICFQALLYPMLDDRTAARTDHAARSAMVWTNVSNRFGWKSYLGTEPGAEDVPEFASAARCEDLAGLPPAWIGVGDADLFHDENLAYADRLRAAGVEVALDIVPGMYHGADDMRPDAPLMIDFIGRLRAAIGRAVGANPIAEDDARPDERRGHVDRSRSMRAWGLHGLVAASAIGAVSLDRRIRRRRPEHSSSLAPLVAAGAFQAVVRTLEVRRPHDESWEITRSELPVDAVSSAVTVVTASAVQVAARAMLTRSGALAEKRVGVSRLSTTAGTAIAILSYDLMHSRLHHLMHEWGPGWRFHSVHHSPKRLNSANGARFQFLEIAIDSFIEGLLLDRLGLSRDQHLAYQAVRNTYGQLQHSNIDLRSGVLDHVFSTPDLHRWHHSTVYEEGDTNFGSVVSVWDKVFGTWFRPTDRDSPDELGIGRMPDFPRGYLELQRVPIDWPTIRERNAATWYIDSDAEPSLT
ncbi:alpha/beta hydrolase fold domain-containing protein [Actinospongicola halichondriae]|uniref:alpha/beta hydrolase fold domain-containing protein n=1 Tax=Actinospongicola halichondriae TaxID=3236844 RepID=UPI003D3AD270